LPTPKERRDALRAAPNEADVKFWWKLRPQKNVSAGT